MGSGCMGMEDVRRYEHLQWWEYSQWVTVTYKDFVRDRTYFDGYTLILAYLHKDRVLG